MALVEFEGDTVVKTIKVRLLFLSDSGLYQQGRPDRETSYTNRFGALRIVCQERVWARLFRNSMTGYIFLSARNVHDTSFKS